MRTPNLSRCLCLLVVVLLLRSPSASAVKLSASEDIWLDLHVLIQPWVQFVHNLDADPAFQAEFFLRRTRIMLSGQLTRWVSAFVETDQPNWGKDGNWSGAFFVQDAYLSLDFHEGIRVVGGMLLIPFVHQAAQGATSLHTLDYHVDLIKYPKGSNKVWRDTGVMIRGLLLGKRLDYRVAMTGGVQDADDLIEGVQSNPDHLPRVSGRAAFNVFDAEDGFFLSGTYLGSKRVLSFGAAFDVQPEVFGEGEPYWAVGGDIFWDIPVGEDRVSGQLDLVTYGGEANPDRGLGLLFDVGYAFGSFEPLVALDWFAPDFSRVFEDHLLGVHGGMNYWFRGHSICFKLDLGFVKGPGKALDRTATVGTLQAQVYL